MSELPLARVVADGSEVLSGSRGLIVLALSSIGPALVEAGLEALEVGEREGRERGKASA